MTFEELSLHRSALRNIVEMSGVRPAIIYINSLTSHRFTALYRFSGGMLKHNCFYDRDNPTADHSPEIPIEASYCIFLKTTGANFSTPDSLDDDRVINHPKREEIKSYCGVPLITPSGEMFGSLCHFDFEAMTIDDEMITLMEDFANILMDSDSLAS